MDPQEQHKGHRGRFAETQGNWQQSPSRLPQTKCYLELPGLPQEIHIDPLQVAGIVKNDSITHGAKLLLRKPWKQHHDVLGIARNSIDTQNYQQFLEQYDIISASAHTPSYHGLTALNSVRETAWLLHPSEHSCKSAIEMPSTIITLPLQTGLQKVTASF